MPKQYTVELYCLSLSSVIFVIFVLVSLTPLAASQIIYTQMDQIRSINNPPDGVLAHLSLMALSI